MEIDITRAIILGVVTLAAFSLGFIIGKAYVKRKMRRREEIAIGEIMFGKETHEKQMAKVREAEKEDDDTKTGEMVRVKKGHPKDA